MPWGGSEKHLSTCKRRPTSKAHSLLCAPRSIHSLRKASLTPLPGKRCPRTYYGAVELDLNWAHPLEMLSFGQGDLTVTSRHWWRNQLCSLHPGRLAHYDNVCQGYRLTTSEDQYREWSRAVNVSALLRTKLTGNSSGDWKQRQRIRKKSSREQKSNNEGDYDRPEPFMGRGSPSVTTAPWSCKVTLWILVLSLLLLSAMKTSGAPTSVLGGQSDTEPESDTSATSDPKTVDFVLEEDIDLSIKSAWSSKYENTTSEGHGKDESQDNILLRAERSSKVPGKGKNGNRNKKHGAPKNGDNDCSKQSLRMRVRDLDMGHNSDEWITFYYCSGSCKQSSNYDRTLTKLLERMVIPTKPQEQVSNQPCCRPTGLLPVSFMDVNNNWIVVNKLSAANCKCGR
ncbi:artemin [Mixophyes fleayi]|uniref:artemin n=1 Tax=Mixophyes fleayi TaxID=3061075 RepID=UPI003F4DF1D4